MTEAERANEKLKLLAGAANNVGVAMFVTGVISPLAAYALGSLQIDDPLRLLAFVAICFVLGGVLLGIAQRIVKELE